MNAIESSLDRLWDYQDPLATEKAFLDLLAKEPKHQAEILTQIARTLSLQGRFEEAHHILDELENLPRDERVQVRTLLERGRTLHSAKQPDKARHYFLEAYALAKRIGADVYTIDAAHMMAIAAPPQEQILWHERCLELCETSSDERAQKWLGSVTHNLAWTYHDQGQFEKALETFQKALDWHKSHGTPQTLHIAKWSVARVLRSLKRVQEALDMQQNLLQTQNEDGFVYEELAECYLALKQEHQAGPYFAKAYELLAQDPWFAEHEQERLERLKSLQDLA